MPEQTGGSRLVTGWAEVLSKLTSRTDLTTGEASWAMEQVMEGSATPAQLGAFLGALRAKGETVDEIAGLVSVMRRLGRRVDVDGPLLDTCGTGGDRAGTVNVSTLAALVAAGAGARVAKHGNRAASSMCGSADVLEALGVKVDAPPEVVAACIREAGIGFCFAPVFHPSMRHAAPVRKELGIPTVFNFLGPLTNPAGAQYQALGVADSVRAPKMVEVLGRLGSRRVLAFRGSDGLDELTTTGASHVWELNDGAVREWDLDPAEFGLPPARPESLRGGSPQENARAAQAVLAGENGAVRDVVLLNSAAALTAAGIAAGIAEGLEEAARSIDSGRAQAALDALVEVSNRPPPA